MTRLAAMFALLLGLAACGSTPEPRPQRAESYERCLANLDQMQARYVPIGDVSSGRSGCGVRDGVELTAVGAQLSRPAQMTCDLAQSVARFDREVLQPLAKRYFNQRVVTVHHAGSYVCKTMTGRRDRMSEHASGNAIDIWSFELADGTKISVKQDWRRSDRRGQFLREVSEKSCKHFQLVLSPNRDAAHHNHLHLDNGRHRLCGV